MKFKKYILALAGVARWTEGWTANQRVAGSTPTRAHAWVVGQVPGTGHMRDSHTLMFFFPSFPLPFPLSQNE